MFSMAERWIRTKFAPPCANVLSFPIRRDYETNLMMCTVVSLLFFADDWLGSHLHLVFSMRETMVSRNGSIRCGM